MNAGSGVLNLLSGQTRPSSVVGNASQSGLNSGEGNSFSAVLGVELVSPTKPATDNVLLDLNIAQDWIQDIASSGDIEPEVTGSEIAPTRNDVMALMEQMTLLLDDAGVPSELLNDLKLSLGETRRIESGEAFVAAIRDIQGLMRDAWLQVDGMEGGTQSLNAIPQRFELLYSSVGMMTGTGEQVPNFNLMASLPKPEVMNQVSVPLPSVDSAAIRGMLQTNVSQLSSQPLIGLQSSVDNFIASPLPIQPIGELVPTNLVPAAQVTQAAISTESISPPRMEFSAQVLPREMASVEALSSRLTGILGDKISMQFSSKTNDSVATVRLDPPELGRIDLRVRVEGDRINVSVIPTNAATREAVELSLDRLRSDIQSAMSMNVDVSMGDESRALLWGQDDPTSEELGTTETNAIDDLDVAKPSMEGVVAKA